MSKKMPEKQRQAGRNPHETGDDSIPQDIDDERETSRNPFKISERGGRSSGTPFTISGTEGSHRKICCPFSFLSWRHRKVRTIFHVRRTRILTKFIFFVKLPLRLIRKLFVGHYKMQGGKR
jgi:hypothetical protein